MDALVLAFKFLLDNPDMAAEGARVLMAPGQVTVQQMGQSFADLSRGILRCYHKTATYHEAQVLAKPWRGQSQYSADGSAVIGIQYSGMTGSAYRMAVAFMWQGQKIRTHVLMDTATVPWNRGCQLENWSG